MASATVIIDRLIARGVIPREFREDAARELHGELRRRSRRTASMLAALVSNNQRILHTAARSA